MQIERIGEVIASLRREKNVTQEELAQFVGVSAQAVSKWENGGAPDCALLPRIADFFGVTTDALFGRKGTERIDLEAMLAQRVMETPREEKLPFLYALCWTMQRALFGDLPETSREIYASRGVSSRCASEYRSDAGGHTHVGMDENLPYFFLLPKSPSLSDLGVEPEDFCDLFRALSDRAVLDALLLTARLPENSFTVKGLAEMLSVSEEKSAEVLTKLVQFHAVEEVRLKLDQTEQTIYRCRTYSTSVLPALLLPAMRMLRGVSCYEGYMGSQTPCMK